jgi:hypothetical protein
MEPFTGRNITISYTEGKYNVLVGSNPVQAPTVDRSKALLYAKALFDEAKAPANAYFWNSETDTAVLIGEKYAGHLESAFQLEKIGG